jgi:bile acid-coenzyme A ligase
MPIGAAISWLAERDPDRPAITHGDRTITRRELDRRTNRLARAYAAMGVGHDDLVTIALPNSIEFYEACVGAWKLGATPQPVSARLPQRERDAIVELADPALVVGVEAGTYGDRPTVAPGFEPDAGLSDEPVEERTAAAYKAPTSGGSTGRPKIIVSGQAGTTDPETPGAFGMDVDGVQLVPGPLYHNGPFMFSMQGLFKGQHLVVMSRFDAGGALDLIEQHGVTWMLLVPTMMLRIWRLPEEERLTRDVSSVKGILHLAAPCPAWLKEAWIGWLSPEVIWELYAGTEGQGVTIVGGKDWLEHRGTVGRPAAGRMKILDDDGRDLPPGDVGEVWMRVDPDRPSYRYIGAEARRRDEADEVWESLGDMGWMDADGYLYLTDRRADMILSGGANIYPAEIEAALEEHPQVLSSAVVGLPDDDMGNVLHAVVQIAGDTSDDELRAHLADRVVTYKIPRTFERVDEPVRDDAGKVRRSGLAAERTGPRPRTPTPNLRQ